MTSLNNCIEQISYRVKGRREQWESKKRRGARKTCNENDTRVWQKQNLDGLALDDIIIALNQSVEFAKYLQTKAQE
jgi:hypothetical protein